MRWLVAWLFSLCSIWGAMASAAEVGRDRPVAIAVHGGAGTIRPEDLTPALEQQIEQTLLAAAGAGHHVLLAGGSSVDAVQAAVVLLEDSPLFNAGKGAVFNAQRVNELDAAIMNGANLNAGAVAALRQTRNPILAARAVMDHSPHVLLIGEGAEHFASQRKLTKVEPSYFHTDKRLEQLERAKAKEQFGLGAINGVDEIYSTVGAVALDRDGNLAAGTSTGGLSNKRWGRVGDVPIIGAGTYANNASCAVSATGHGEYFIRSVVAYDICAQVEYRGIGLQAAAEQVVMQKLVERGGSGGVIAIDPTGHIALVFNTSGMYRAAIDATGRQSVGIYRDRREPNNVER